MSKKHKAITNALELAASECVRCPNCGDKPVLSYDWKKKRWPWRLTHNKAICPGRFCLEAEKGTVEECVTLWNEHSARNLQWKTGKETTRREPLTEAKAGRSKQDITTRLLCDLIGATSAYEMFAKGDALKSSRVQDWKLTIAAAKKARKKPRPKKSEHIYIYTIDAQGRYTYERSVPRNVHGERRARERIRELKAVGFKNAVKRYTVHPKGFY